MPILSRRNNRSNKTIQQYIKTIQNSILPELDEYGLNFALNPSMTSMTKVKFVGYDYNKIPIAIDFYSNNAKLSDYDNSYLDCDVHYNSGADNVGPISTNDIGSTIELIVSSFNALGYKTPSEAELIRQQEEQKKEAEKQKEKDRMEKNKKEIDDLIANNKSNKDAEDAGDTEDDFDELNPEEFSSIFKRYIKVMTELGSSENKIVCTMMSFTGTNYRGISVDVWYVSPTLCFVESSGVKPRVSSTSTWEKAENYILKLSEAVNAPISLFAIDGNNKSIPLPKEDDSDDSDLDLGVSL